MTAPVEHSGHGPAAFLTRKLGPLPYWAWMLIALVVLYAVVQWRASVSGASSAASDAATPADNTPPEVDQNYISVTLPSYPPAGGRTNPPTGVSTAPPAGATGGSGTTAIPPPPAKGTPTTPVKTTPKPTSGATPSPAPSGTTVTVAKYTTVNPPWNSTLSGIASKEGYGSNWQAIWNAPANAALKARRKTPNLIQPGDKVVVPAK